MANKYLAPAGVLVVLVVGATWESLASGDESPPLAVSTSSSSPAGHASTPAARVTSAPTSSTLMCTATGAAPFETAHAEVAVVGPDVQVRWTWAGQPPRGGAFGLFATLDGPGDHDMHQLGYKALDGTQIGLFDFDLITSQQTNVADQATPDAAGVTLTFPGSAAPFLNGFTATGAVTLNGNDVMACK